MVDKGAVLFRIEHFEHRARGVAAEVVAHLVDLVEQDQRIRRLGLFQRLDDLARHRADVGAPVTADLGLIAHAAQADADELAPGRARHGLAEAGLAHARRADEAQDRPLQLARALLHREILDNPFLDLLQPVMVGVEHGLGIAQVLLHPAFHPPWDRQHPVEIVAHHRGLGAHRAHVLELLDLALGLFARLFRKLGVGHPLFQFGHLVLALAVFAELLLDRLHLFVEVIFALGALHLALHPGLDLFLDLENAHFALHQAVDLLQPLVDRQRLQKLLLLRHLHTEMAGHEVGELGGFGGFRHRGQRLFGDVLLDLGVALELFVHAAGERGGGVLVDDPLGQRLGLGLEIGGVFVEPGDRHPALALDQHFHRAVGQLEQLQHVRQHADAVDAVGVGIVHRGVDLARQQDLLVFAHHRFERLDGFFAPDEERHDHVREHHDIAQGQNRVGGGLLLGHFFSLFSAGGTAPTLGSASRLLFAR